MYSPNSNYSPAPELPQQPPLDASLLPYYDKVYAPYAPEYQDLAIATSLPPVDPLPLSSDYYQVSSGLGVEFAGASPSPVGNRARAAKQRHASERADERLADPIAHGLAPELGPQYGLSVRPPSRPPPSAASSDALLQQRLVNPSIATLTASRSPSCEVSSTPGLTSAASTMRSTPSTFDAGYWSSSASQWGSALQPPRYSPRAVSSRPTSTPAMTRYALATSGGESRRAVSSSPLRSDLAGAPKRRRVNHPLSQMELAVMGTPSSANVAFAQGGNAWVPPVAAGDEPRHATGMMQARGWESRSEDSSKSKRAVAPDRGDVGARSRKRAWRE